MSNNTNSSGNSTFFEEAEAPKPVKISVFTPLIYVAIILTTFVIFSKVYRQRSLKRLSRTKPFFPENAQKQIYLELKENDPKANDKVLKAALFRWASESIRRTLKLKECEPFMTKMYQAGSIGDDLWTRFTLAQKLEELEIQEIIQEVELIKANWSAKFFPLLQEITFNEAIKRRVLAIDLLKETQLEQWGVDLEAVQKKLALRPKVKLELKT